MGKLVELGVIENFGVRKLYELGRVTLGMLWLCVIEKFGVRKTEDVGKVRLGV